MPNVGERFSLEGHIRIRTMPHPSMLEILTNTWYHRITVPSVPLSHTTTCHSVSYNVSCLMFNLRVIYFNISKLPPLKPPLRSQVAGEQVGSGALIWISSFSLLHQHLGTQSASDQHWFSCGKNRNESTTQSANVP